MVEKEVDQLNNQNPKIPLLMKMKMKMKVENENKDIVYPYQNDEFIEIWKQFKIYKHTEFNFQFKSTQSEQAALSKLPNEMLNVDHANTIYKKFNG